LQKEGKARRKDASMPFLPLIIAVVIIVVLLLGALFFGLIGGVKEGPDPHEGSKWTG
jgi:cobalamin biosynthesis Mg chelatase CobN